ncbi:MAG: glutamine-hydrolyzing GMP synthase [Promethearchaeota archaeon]
MDTILVLDFGSQLAHLIARRIRDLGVYSEILPFNASLSQIKSVSPVGVVFSGGPSSVYDENAPHLESEIFHYFEDQKIPLLGLCYGHQLIAQFYNGKVEPHEEKEFGHTEINLTNHDNLFKGLGDHEIVWMSHGDQVGELPPGYEIYAQTDTCPIAAMGNPQKKIFGLQFHPEVHHTIHGTEIFSNFLFEICRAKAEWKLHDWIENSIKKIRETVGDNHVILGLSGGVDSSVVAILLQKAIGDNVHPIFVNNGLLRQNEVEQVCDWFQNRLKFKNFHLAEAEQEFLNNLKDISDPEQKRKIIGHTFIDVFERTAKELESSIRNIKFLAQGTIYPDRVESQAGSGGKTSSKIKSHHNLALPEDMKLKVLEPLRDLYKDEVRKIGETMGLPRELIERHPFPGPGLAIRCVGDITKDKLEILRHADSVVVEEIQKAGLYNSVWQAFAVFLPVKSVGVMGDYRTYEYLCALRIVESIDAMTANFAKLDWAILERISTRIINEVSGINRVVYDISNKPPATIEFE